MGGIATTLAKSLATAFGIAAASMLILRGTRSAAAATAPMAAGAFTGRVMGGLSPISDAKVRLYAMGHTGYGSAPTLLATTASDLSGTFSVPLPTCPAGNPETYILALGGNAGHGSNSAIALMAVLGPCGSLGSSTTVIVNEATTVSAQWGLAQFSDPTGQKIGTSSTNTKGLANALLEIRTDLMNSATGGPAAFLPTAADCSGGSPPVNCDALERLDTLANILAACVESSGPTSSACGTLLSHTGSSTTTLQAAHVMASKPTANVGALFALQSGSPPFTPELSAAPDGWEIALNFAPRGSNFNNPCGVAIDAAGNVWVTNSEVISDLGKNGSVTKLTSNGALAGNFNNTNTGGASFHNPLGVAIDASGNVWMANCGPGCSTTSGNEGIGVTKLTSSGGLIGNFNNTNTSGADFYNPHFLAIDAAGNVWVTNCGSDCTSGGPNNGSVTKLSTSGACTGGDCNFDPIGANFNNAQGAAIDAAGNVWVTNLQGNSLSKLTSSGACTAGNCNFDPIGANFHHPRFVAIDAAGNVWVANEYGNSVTELTSSGGLVGNFAPRGANFNGPLGVAIDAARSVWVTNGGGNSVTELASSGTCSGGNCNFAPRGANFNEPAGVAVDATGNVWVANLASNSVAELVGAARPVLTPLVACLKKTPPHAVCLP